MIINQSSSPRHFSFGFSISKLVNFLSEIRKQIVPFKSKTPLQYNPYLNFHKSICPQKGKYILPRYANEIVTGGMDYTKLTDLKATGNGA